MRIVEVKGKDSAEFLHRVTAGAVRGVGVNEGREGLLLTGRSVVVAQFDLLHVEEHRFFLAAPEPCAVSLAEALEALHFSESLEISLTSFTVGAREWSGVSREAGKNCSVSQYSSELTWASLVPGFSFSTGITGFPATWAYHRIAALHPWVCDWAGQPPALEAGFLPWIDRFKGCYPGQEVVELSLNVGHPARVLISVGSTSPFEEKIIWNGAEARVTSSASLAGKHAALVRIPWSQRDFIPPGFTLLKSHW